MELTEIASRAIEALEAKNEAREEALALSRELTRHAANTIRAVHRGETERAQKMLAEGRAMVETIRSNLRNHPDLYHAGYTQDSLKEFAEANLTYVLITDGAVPEPEDLGVDHAPYLKGLGEAAGELRRHALDQIRRGKVEDGERTLEHMDEIYSVLVSIDFPNAITQGLRRTTDMVRGVLERTRGDLTLALRQDQLEKTLREFERDRRDG